MAANRVKLKILSPVHVGSGVKMREGLDFVLDDGRIHIVSMERLIEKLRKRPEAIDRLSSNHFNLGTYLRDFGLKSDSISSYSLEGNLPGGAELTKCIKTGTGMPIIPGSSLKGSIRTSVLWKLTHTERDEEMVLRDSARATLKRALQTANTGNRRYASKNAAAVLEGAFVEKEIQVESRGRRKKIRGPNNSLMRALQVPDAGFEPSDLCLARVQVTSEDKQEGVLWENFGRANPNQRDPDRASRIYVEAIRAGSETEIKIGVEDFLVELASEGGCAYDPGKEEIEIFRDIRNLFRAINMRSFELMDGECDYIDKANSGQLEVALQFYYAQMERIDDTPEDFCIMPLGWGTGWRGMTGPVVPDDMMEQFRRTFRRMEGRRGWDSFPKTRKYCFEGSKPGVPPGWIELSLM